MKQKEDKIFLRPRIQKELASLGQTRLVVLCAPAGHGKTTAMRGYLQSVPGRRYLWMAFARVRDHPDWLWNEFCTAAATVDAALAGLLREHGMPRGARACGYIAKVIAERLPARTPLIFDDLQWCAAPAFQLFLRTLAATEADNLRLIFLTRRLAPEDEHIRCSSNQSIRFLGTEALRFTLEETRRFFVRFFGEVSDYQLARIYAESAGVPAALQLACVRCRECPQIPDISESIVMDSILDDFEEADIRLLLCLEPLGSCTADEAVAAAGNARAEALLADLAKRRWFVQFDGNNGRYYLHSLLLGALQPYKKRWHVQTRRVLRRVADWQAASGDVVAAIRLYTRGEVWDGVLRIMERTGASEYFDLAPGVFIQAFEHMPEEKKLRRPFAYLTYLHDYALVDESGGAYRQIEAVKARYEAREELPQRTQILGELALIESFLHFNDIKRMAVLQQEAHTLLAGRKSRIFHRDMVFTFGSPSMLALYYREAGELTGVLDIFDERIHCFTECANGCGAGAALLLHAEAAFEQGAWGASLGYLGQAHAEATVNRQESLLLSAEFLELRLLAARGCWPELRAKRAAFTEKYGQAEAPLIKSAAALAGAHIDLLLGEYERVPQWLKDFDLQKFARIPQARVWLYILYGRLLLIQDKAEELEALARELLRMESAGQYFFLRLAGHLFQTAARGRMEGMEAGMESFRRALELARADGMQALFWELPEIALPFLEQLWYQDVFARRVLLLCREVQQRHAAMRAPARMTAQELHIMRRIADGQNRAAIAAECNISLNTVKKHLSNIYKKLGVTRQTQALKLLREQGLLK